MKSMINIGNEIIKNDTTVMAVANAVAIILKSGAENHSEQETIRTALKLISEVGEVKNVNVTNSSFVNGQPAPSCATPETNSDPSPTEGCGSCEDEDDLDD